LRNRRGPAPLTDPMFNARAEIAAEFTALPLPNLPSAMD